MTIRTSKHLAAFAALMGALSPAHALAATCGDKIIASTEACDDGNTTDGDGCDATCAVEVGWECGAANFSLDFSEYTNDSGHDTPVWSLSADKLTLKQSLNADPAVYMTNIPITGNTITFTQAVKSTSDDDFVGFVVGFEAGDFSSSTAEWILFDWKQATQAWGSGTGKLGFSVSRVTGQATPDHLWNHITTVTELGRGTNQGSKGWKDNTTYTFQLTYSETNIVVYIDGVKELDITGTFPEGNFGFYNLSLIHI